MPSTGGTVIVEAFPNSGAGYEINAAISVPSNVTLIGRGNVRITVRGDSPAFQNSDTLSGNERIVISGFTCVGDRSNGYSYDRSLIRLEKVKNCIIENCILQAVRPSSYSNGIYLYGDGSYISEGTIISGCTIFGGDTAGLSFGIHFVQYCQNNMITNNTVYNCKESCQILDSSKWNVISGNVFRNSVGTGTYGGLYIQGSDFNVISGNECNSNIKGIYLYTSSGCTVHGNICNSNSSGGVTISGTSAAPAQYNVVSGNVCNSNTTNGILLDQYAKFTSVSGNNANSNTFYGIRESSGTGSNYNISAGNVCSSNTSGQVSMTGANSISPDNMVS